MRTLLFWIAGGLLVAGVVLGFLPVKSGEFSCGSAFHKSGNVAAKEFAGTLSGGPDYGTQDCAGVRSAALQLPVLSLILAASIGAGALMADREVAARPTGRRVEPPAA